MKKINLGFAILMFAILVFTGCASTGGFSK